MKTVNWILSGMLSVALLFAGVASPAVAQDDWDPNVRPVSLVSRTPQEYVLDNVRWGSTFDGNLFSTVFKRTRIRPDLVKDIFLWTEDFPPKFVAAHVLLAFTFRNPDGVKAADGTADVGLVISVANRLRRGETASSFAKAFFPYRANQPWPLIFEVGTLSDRLQQSLIMFEHVVKQYRLRLDQASKVKILRAGLEMSLVDRSRDYYQVVQNNCVVAAIRILKEGLGEAAFPGFWAIKDRLVGYQVSLPKFTAGYLAKRGLREGGPKVFDADHPRVGYETDAGTVEIDISRMAGFRKAPLDVIPFAEGVRYYVRTSEAIEELQTLLDNLTGAHASFPIYQDLQFKFQAQLNEIVGGLIQQVQRRPAETMAYYVRCLQETGRTRDPLLRPLHKTFLDVLRFKASIKPGEVVPPYQEHLQALAGMM